MVDQDPPQRFGSRCIKVWAILPRQFARTDELEIRPVDQSRGLQRVSAALAREASLRRGPQLGVHEGQQEFRPPRRVLRVVQE